MVIKLECDQVGISTWSPSWIGPYWNHEWIRPGPRIQLIQQVEIPTCSISWMLQVAWYHVWIRPGPGPGWAGRGRADFWPRPLQPTPPCLLEEGPEWQRVGPSEHCQYKHATYMNAPGLHRYRNLASGALPPMWNGGPSDYGRCMLIPPGSRKSDEFSRVLRVLIHYHSARV